MRRNLAASLLEHGAVRTTPAKAKEVRRFVERLITIARQGTLHARRRVIALLRDRQMVDKENPAELAGQTVVQKLFNEIAPRYADRPGGYTRLIRLPERRIGDGGEQVLLQLVEEARAPSGGESGPVAARRRRRAARRAEQARASVGGAAPAREAPARTEEDETPEQVEPEGAEQEARQDEGPEGNEDEQKAQQ